MFCKRFETLEDAQNSYPVKECSECQKNIFESQYSQSDDPSKRFNVSDWI